TELATVTGSIACDELHLKVFGFDVKLKGKVAFPGPAVQLSGEATYERFHVLVQDLSYSPGRFRLGRTAISIDRPQDGELVKFLPPSNQVGDTSAAEQSNQVLITL